MVSEKLRFPKDKSLLRTLVKNSFRALDDGIYDYRGEKDYSNHEITSLRNKIIKSQNVPVITEIKYASPSKGNLADPEKLKIEYLAKLMQESGACGISVLSQPFLFNGSVTNVYKVRNVTTLPILMKDIIVSETQLKAAKRAGADCVLLIMTVFDMNLTEQSLETTIESARKAGLEIILETHTSDEFIEAINLNKRHKESCLIGINNRNLDTLEISLDTTINILSENSKSKSLVISESGIYQSSDVSKLLNAGADAFLIGTSLMQKPEIMSESLKEIIVRPN